MTRSRPAAAEQATVPAPVDADGLQAEAPPPTARILLVDDRADNLLALEAVLEPLGFELVSVESGEEALRRLLQDEFAAIVLDVQMPVLDGFETARLIKAREKTRHVPIIFLTAISGEAEHFRLGYATGAVDYVYKPFDPDILRAKVTVFAELWLRGALIQRQAAELSRRLGELAAARTALARQADELERSNLALERFAEMTAQELRDPLHTVAGLLELLVARHRGELGDEALLLADRAAAGVARAQGLVISLLEYARASSEGLVVEALPLESVVDEAIQEREPVLAERKITVAARGLPSVIADRRLLVALMTALLDQAIARDATEPRVLEVTAQPREGGWAISVADPAWTEDPAELARLFTPLGPAPGIDSDAAVAGVGLALCRRIIERHGGAIWAEAGPQEGCAVWFTLAGGAS